jgi:siroheme synthase-like protein
MGLMLHVDVRGRRVVVVGAGRAGREKLARLLAAGADVTVVDPVAAPDLDATGVSVLRRHFTTGDVAGAWLVVAATDDERANDRVEQVARAAGALVIRADRPDGGGVSFAATLERGPVTVAVATGGASPALARWLRDRISDAVPPAVADLARLLAGRARGAGGRGHGGLAFEEVLAALECGDVARARALLGLTDGPPLG